MSYDPTIPKATDRPSVSQGQILTNFSEINTQFGIEHTALDAGASLGKHKYITLKQNPGAPLPVGTDLNFQQGTAGGKYSVETQDSGGIFRHVPLRTLRTVFINAGAPWDNVLVDFATGFGTSCSGTILVYDTTKPSRLIFCPFVWVTPNLSIPSAQYGQIISGGYGVTDDLKYLFDAGTTLVLHHGGGWAANNVRVIITESRTS